MAIISVVCCMLLDFLSKYKKKLFDYIYDECNYFYINFIKRNFKQWRVTILPILTKRTTTLSHKTTTYGVEIHVMEYNSTNIINKTKHHFSSQTTRLWHTGVYNPCPRLGQAHTCDGVKQVIEIPTLPSS